MYLFWNEKKNVFLLRTKKWLQLTSIFQSFFSLLKSIDESLFENQISSISWISHAQTRGANQMTDWNFGYENITRKKVVDVVANFPHTRAWQKKNAEEMLNNCNWHWHRHFVSSIDFIYSLFGFYLSSIFIRWNCCNWKIGHSIRSNMQINRFHLTIFMNKKGCENFHVLMHHIFYVCVLSLVEYSFLKPFFSKIISKNLVNIGPIEFIFGNQTFLPRKINEISNL